jgi:ABC-2 type transport system ATP-binding protein
MVEISNIRTLQKNNYKEIGVLGQHEPASFEMPGVSNLHREGEWTQFFYSGDINLVLQRVSGFEIEDLSIEEPTLEEIFMHYYE